MVGGSFAFTDWLAVTAGMKYSMYTAEQSIGFMGIGTMSKTERKANAFSGFGGIMLTPTKEVNLTVLYSSKVLARGKETDMKYHYSKITEERLPEFVLIGLNVKPAESVEIQASYQLSFSGQKDYANRKGERLVYAGLTNATDFVYADMFTPTLGGNSENYKYRHEHKLGLGAEFTLSSMFILSAGVSYGTQEKYTRAQSPFDPNLRSIGIGVGGKIKATDKVSIELGAAKYTYFTDHMAFGLIKLNKSVWSFGLGITGKIM
jgi:long-subunit fatty acid transport protein